MIHKQNNRWMVNFVHDDIDLSSFAKNSTEITKPKIYNNGHGLEIENITLLLSDDINNEVSSAVDKLLESSNGGMAWSNEKNTPNKMVITTYNELNLPLEEWIITDYTLIGVDYGLLCGTGETSIITLEFSYANYEHVLEKLPTL